jgi:hypothetical protein
LPTSKTIGIVEVAVFAALAGGGPKAAIKSTLTLQLPSMKLSESMGNHDSKIVDADSVD